MTLPHAMLPYQQRWCADESRVRVWEKSRRIGASWAVASESVFYAGKRNGGSSTYYTSYNKETTSEFIRDCATWSKAYRFVHVPVTEETVVDADGEEILTYVIRFGTGHRIVALSSKPSNLRNRKGRIVIDEAAFVPDLAETMKAAMAVLMWGGHVDILSTHNGVDSPFNALIEDIRGGRKSYSLHRTDFDDALADGLYRRICMVNGWDWNELAERAWREELIEDYGDDADEELFCIPRRSGGTYLRRDLLERQMLDAPVFRFEAQEGFAKWDDDQRTREILAWCEGRLLPLLRQLDPSLMHVFGEDFGRSADLTVIAPMAIKQDLRRVVPFTVELRDTPFREQETCLNFVVDRLPRFVYGALDATGNGQYMAERAWQRYGEQYIEQINLTDKWYNEHLPPVKAGLEDGMLWLPRDADVLVDLLALQTINGIPKLPKLRNVQIAGARKTQKKRHGDTAIAVALAHYSSRQQLPSYGYTSAGKRGASTTSRVRTFAAGSGGFRSRSGGVL